MPLNGAGLASKPAGTTAVSNTTIESSKMNSVIDDIYNIFNTVRPVAYGGTGGATVSATKTALSIESKGSDITSAATITLTENYHHVTGSTGPITDIDFTDAVNGRWAWLIFDSTPTITHNATTLKLPGGANIVAAAGDRALFIQDAADNVICLEYVPAAHGPIITGTFTPALSASGATFSYASRTGKYTRNGNVVDFQIVITLNTSGNTLTANVMSLSGLPFTSDAANNAVCSMMWAASTTAYVNVFARVTGGVTGLEFFGITAAATSAFAAINSNALLHATNGSILVISGRYLAA